MKKKIFYWSPFFSNIATVKSVLNSAISLKKFSKEYQPFIIDVFGEWDEYKYLLIEKNISIKKLNLDLFFRKKKINGYFKSRYYQIKIFLLAFFPLIKLLKKNQPDYIILHLVTSLPMLINFFFKNKSKVILRISGLPKLNFFRKFFWNIFLKKISRVTTPTKATLNILKKEFNIDKIFLLRDPILHIKNIKKNRVKNDNKKQTFVSIGRLTKQKNFIFLLKCFKEIVKKNSEINLNILGEGEEYEKLKKYIKKNNLEKNIFLKGYQEKIYEYLSLSDAFILSSLWEDPGFVLIEAAYANIPIISSDCRNGPIEILDNGKNGFLYKSNNIKEFIKTFEIFKNSNPSSIYEKTINAKKMTRNYTLYNHYKNMKQIL